MHQPIREIIRNEFVALTEGVKAALQRKYHRQPSGSQMVNSQERVLAVLLCDGEGILVNVFALDRQRLEVGKHVSPDGSEFFYIVGADIKIDRFLLLRECVRDVLQ